MTSFTTIFLRIRLNYGGCEEQPKQFLQANIDDRRRDKKSLTVFWPDVVGCVGTFVTITVPTVVPPPPVGLVCLSIDLETVFQNLPLKNDRS